MTLFDDSEGRGVVENAADGDELRFRAQEMAEVVGGEAGGLEGKMRPAGEEEQSRQQETRRSKAETRRKTAGGDTNTEGGQCQQGDKERIRH